MFILVRSVVVAAGKITLSLLPSNVQVKVYSPSASAVNVASLVPLSNVHPVQLSRVIVPELVNQAASLVILNV